MSRWTGPDSPGWTGQESAKDETLVITDVVIADKMCNWVVAVTVGLHCYIVYRYYVDLVGCCYFLL